jgi:hypothetical protein
MKSMIDYAVGSSGSSRKDYDPEKTALQAYDQMVNPNSPWWRFVYGRFNKAFQGAAITPDTLFSANRAEGISGEGSTALAVRKALDESRKATESAGNAFGNAFMQSQESAKGYLSLAQNANQFNKELEFKKSSEWKDLISSFADNIFGLGGGIATSLLNKPGQSGATENAFTSTTRRKQIPPYTGD